MNTLKITLALLLGASSALAAEVRLSPFSASTDSAIPDAWEPFSFSNELPETEFRIVLDDQLQRMVLEARADSSVSGLAHEVDVDPVATPLINFSWWVEASIAAADLSSKEGDDYAARVYVVFDYPREKLSWGLRTQLKIAETLYGVEIPTAALIYVWDNKHPIETTVPNAYTDRAWMIVLDSGDEHAGTWREHSRDVGADFERAFGEPAPRVSAVIVTSDTDNTQSTALARFGDIHFSAR